MAINTNLRKVKRIVREDEVTFTIEPLSALDKNDRLCNHCARRDAVTGFSPCPVYKQVKSLGKKGFELSVRKCSSYQPVLGFQDETGLDAEVFNTFRLGSAWSQRVAPGDIVGLVNVSTGTVFSKAVVVESYCEPKAKAYRLHAHKNHLMLGLSKKKAAESMDRLLRSIYGNMYVENAKQLSVIYLRQLDENEGRT